VWSEQVYTKPTEVIDLKVHSSIRSSEEYTNIENSFNMYSKESTFSMVAPNKEEKQDWIRKIGKAIMLTRTTYDATGFDRQRGAGRDSDDSD
jgi:hypothetical protein